MSMTPKPRQPKHHELKMDHEHRSYIASGIKRFELRLNDRGYQVGDTFRLIDNETGGMSEVITIRYVLTDAEKYGLLPGYCIFCW